ncbi:DUF2528 family protein [Collimonas antrihumi]|uniref:DUF2528 family protein n=1 Tax=Collimonas antrihumi TaxID=1940615 RepID=UPI001B8CA1AF|nr:DUF2528 family protein [Collimonas antrihumi]
MDQWIRFTMTYDDTYSDVVVDVLEPTSDKMIALCTQINEFWYAADWRLKESDGDVVKAVMTLLCRSALLEHMINPLGALHAFSVDGMEGWPKLDGSEGIKLISVENFDFVGDVSVACAPLSQCEQLQAEA